MTQQTWFWQAFGAATLFVPSVLAIGFFKKNYGYSTDAFLAWYFLATTVVCFVFPLALGKLTVAELAFNRYAAGAMAFGMVFNAAANTLLFRAYAAAPNPGLAEAVVDSKNVLVFLVALLMSTILPKLFATVKFHPMHALGIGLVTVGTVILALKWR